MTSRATASVALVLAALAAGCAADAQNPSTSAAPQPEREYRTGSNIPVHEPRPSTAEERARAADQAAAQKRDGTPPKSN